jgi:hypothetical protein
MRVFHECLSDMIPVLKKDDKKHFFTPNCDESCGSIRNLDFWRAFCSLVMGKMMMMRKLMENSWGREVHRRWQEYYDYLET